MMKTDRNHITIFGWFYKLARARYDGNSSKQSNNKRKSDAHDKEDDVNKKNKKKRRRSIRRGS